MPPDVPNPASALQKQKGPHRFKPGESGNPKGRQKGSRNKLTLLAESLLEEDAGAVFRKVISKAKGGDMAAARLILDRVMPVRKGAPVRFALPPINVASDLVAAFGALLKSTADGELTPDEAQVIAGIFDAKRKALETVEIETRLTLLEASAQREDARHDDPKPIRTVGKKSAQTG